MRLTAASKDELLQWGAKYLTLHIGQLERDHYWASTARVEPAALRHEIQKLRHWIARAGKLTESAALTAMRPVRKR